MHPYFASRLAHDREEDFRRRAEVYRLLAQVGPPRPAWRDLLAGSFRRAAALVPLARRRVHRDGRRPQWTFSRPAPDGRGL